MILLRTLLAAAMSLGIALGTFDIDAQSSRQGMSTTPLGAMPNPPEEVSTWTGSKVAHVAYIQKDSVGARVVIDGVLGKTYPSLPGGMLTEAGRPEQIKFSPDGSSYAYIAQTSAGALLVVNKSEGKIYDSITLGSFVFSPDSKRVAYVATRGGKEIIVTDGVESRPYDYLATIPLRFSADSRHIGYSARDGKQTVVVIDGKEVATGEYSNQVEFSNDGKHSVFIFRNGDAHTVIFDGKPGKSYESIGNSVFFSPQGDHVLYRAELNYKQFIVVDDKESSFRGIVPEASYDFAPDGRPAYLFEKDRTDAVVVGEQMGKFYDFVVRPFFFSNDGKRIAYIAISGRKRFVVIDGVEGPKFDEIDSVAFSDDGAHTIYTAHDKSAQESVFLDGKVELYDEVAVATFVPHTETAALIVRKGKDWMLVSNGQAKPLKDRPVTLIFSDDGKHRAFVTAAGPGFVVVSDDKTGRSYESIRNLTYIPDGGHLVYTAERAGKSFLVIDSNESGPFDSFMTPPRISGDGEIGIIATNYGSYWFVHGNASIGN